MLESKILVVDDSPAIVDSLVGALQILGIGEEQILQADTAEKAMTLFEKHKPSVVFMDIQLGTQAGDKVALQMLKAAPKTKIVVITGVDPKDPKVRGLVSAGAYEVIEKPLRLGRIQETLQLIDSEEKGLRRVT